MKGLKVIKAAPSNAIDIYALLKEANKEKVLEGRPNEKQLQNFYFGVLTGQLASPIHRWFLARRGRGYLGYLHAVFIPNQFTGNVEYCYVDSIFVVKKRRKMGIARKMLEEFEKEIDNIGVRTMRLDVPKDDIGYWEKRGFGEIRTMMEKQI